jgi:LemA protein
LFAVLGYNALVRRRNAVDNAFASVDAYLLMRYDLIPNLVETVKGYAAHEAATLEAVVRRRAEALAPGLSTDQRVQLDNRIGPDIGRLVALGEAYPALQASAQFQQLQRGLNEVEERLSAARRAFNAAVLDYNNGVEQFPLNLLAGPLGFRRRAFFEIAQAQRQPVPVAPPPRA